jgi:hypothetical protein
MLRTGRNSDVIVRHTPRGRLVRLIDRRWWMHAQGPGFGFGATYHRPLSVELADETIPIRDHVAIARFLAVAAVVLALISRRFT